MSRSDVIAVIMGSRIPFALKIAIVSFVKAMPEEQFDAMIGEIVEAGQAVLAGDQSANRKLSGLGVPTAIAESLIREARSRHAQH